MFILFSMVLNDFFSGKFVKITIKIRLYQTNKSNCLTFPSPADLSSVGGLLFLFTC